MDDGFFFWMIRTAMRGTPLLRKPGVILFLAESSSGYFGAKSLMLFIF